MNYYVAFYKMKQIRLICNIHNQQIINYNGLDEGINVLNISIIVDILLHFLLVLYGCKAVLVV